MTYPDYIRSLPCLACSKPGPSQFAHTRDGSEGMGKKSSDDSGIPLCAACHLDGVYAYHKVGDEAEWARIWGLDLERERNRLRVDYGNG